MAQVESFTHRAENQDLFAELQFQPLPGMWPLNRQSEISWSALVR